MTALVRTCLAAGAVALAVAVPAAVPAADSGVSYDSVMKFAPDDGSGAPAAPGTFQADFSAASAPQPSHGGGMFAKMIAQAQNMGAMFKTGTAQRHYDGTTKFRTDSILSNTADITDCTARTLTHLDLAAKTYHVTSLDQPDVPSHASGHSEPGPMPTDDGSTYEVSMTTKALGPLTIENEATNGYSMTMTMTATQANGQSATSSFNVVSYYSQLPEPVSGCRNATVGMVMPAGGPHMQMGQMQQALAALGNMRSSKYKMTVSGPPLPSGHFVMWQAISMGGSNSTSEPGSGRGGFRMINERGDVRSLSDSDPVFSVPSDFTKV